MGADLLGFLVGQFQATQVAPGPAADGRVRHLGGVSEV